ncbi:MAG: GIY-YIG nuclease family protein [Pseudomonadota bacterium]
MAIEQMKTFYLYILKCSDGSYYTGHTDDLEKRLAEHGEGYCEYTVKRLPIELVFSDEFATREEALGRERQIKGWSRKKKEALIEGNWDKLKQLAKGE